MFLLALVSFFTRLPVITADDIILGAHRGSNSTENTLEAIEQAVHNPKYSFMEFDVQLTRDGKVVVYHDYTLLRLHGQASIISNTDYDELCKMADVDIPLLEDVLDVVGDEKLIVDVKGSLNNERNQLLVDEIVSIFVERGISDNLMLSSIFPEIVEYSKKEHPNIKTGVSYMVTSVTYIPSERLVDEFYSYIDYINADYIMLHEQHLKNYDLIKDRLPKGKKLIFWSMSEEMYLIDLDKSKLW